MMVKVLILFAFLAPLLFASPAHPKIVDRVVAKVNHEIVTLSDLNAFKKRFGPESEEARPQKEILGALIEETLTKQLIKKLNLSPGSEEVEAEINAIITRQGLTRKDLLQFLKQRGMGYAEYKENIQRSIENRRLLDREIKSEIVIKEEDLRDYYYTRVKTKKPQKSYHIRQIFFPADSEEKFQKQLAWAKKAYEEYQAGVSFKQLLKKYSDDPGEIESLGDLGFLTPDEMIEPLRNSVKRLRVKQLSEPIQTRAGVHLLLLVKVKEGQIQSFKEAQEQIHAVLYEQQFKKLLNRWLKQKKEEAFIEIMPLHKITIKKSD